LLILALLCVGCLEQSAPVDQFEAAGFASFSDPIVEAPAALKPVPDPFLNPPDPEPPEVIQLEPVGFTGVRIFSDPATCNPCRNLDSDLQFLRENHGWTVSHSANVFADWQILPPRDTDQRIPLIEIWQGGQLVDTFAGYSEAETFAERRPALRQLVNAHPVRTLERRP
jgi:hypothetical protein